MPRACICPFVPSCLCASGAFVPSSPRLRWRAPRALPRQGPSGRETAPRSTHGLPASPIDAPAAVYRVAPPDKIRDRLAEGEGDSTTRQSVVIQTDGNISLNMIGQLNVNNLTPAEISEKIVQQARQVLQGRRASTCRCRWSSSRAVFFT